MLLRFHPQGSDAGGLAVRLAVELVAIEAGAHPGRAEEAAHVSLSHVAAGPGDPEELGDAAGRVGVSMGGHAGRHRLAGHDAGRHGGGGSVVANPGGVLDLGVGKEASGLAPCRIRWAAGLGEWSVSSPGLAGQPSGGAASETGTQSAGPCQLRHPQPCCSQQIRSKTCMPAWTGAGSAAGLVPGSRIVLLLCHSICLFFPLPNTSLTFFVPWALLSAQETLCHPWCFCGPTHFRRIRQKVVL